MRKKFKILKKAAATKEKLENNLEWSDYRAPESRSIKEILIRFLHGGKGVPLPPPPDFFKDK